MKSGDTKDLAAENTARIQTYSGSDLQRAAQRFMVESTKPKYSYNFTWLGRPIIQYPQDIVALQEIIWRVKPDLVIETGIAHGGSLVLSASMLALLDYTEAIASKTTIDTCRKVERRVLGIDIDIRRHNREAIEEHPLANRIDMIQGSSIDPAVVATVVAIAARYKKILVLLDSNHTHEHVLNELRSYAPLTSSGSYCVVFDTLIEDMPPDSYPDRPWGRGNNPRTAVSEYLKQCTGPEIVDERGRKLEFEVDHLLEQKLLITVASGGYLRRL